MDQLVVLDKGLVEALAKVLAKDLPGIGKDVVVKDIPDTLKGSFRGFTRIGTAIKNTSVSVKDNGFKNTAKSTFSSAKGFGKSIYNFPASAYGKTSSAVSEFRACLNNLDDPSEKALFVLKFATCLASTAGGAYLGNNLPDKDISVYGIGKHRHFVFHSMLMAGGITVLSKFLCRIFNKASGYVHPDHPDRETLNFLVLNLNLLAFGTSVGVAFHLGIDGTLERNKAVYNPLGGTFIPGTLVDDNFYLTFNSILSGGSAVDTIKKVK